jgi:hypothetical protein
MLLQMQNSMGIFDAKARRLKTRPAKHALLIANGMNPRSSPWSTNVRSATSEASHQRRIIFLIDQLAIDD